MSDNYPRIAIVTGATSGIGEATVRKFVTAGYGVIGNGRNGVKLALLEAELGAAFQGVVANARPGPATPTSWCRASRTVSALC